MELLFHLKGNKLSNTLFGRAQHKFVSSLGYRRSVFLPAPSCYTNYNQSFSATGRRRYGRARFRNPALDHEKMGMRFSFHMVVLISWPWSVLRATLNNFQRPGLRPLEEPQQRCSRDP